MNTILVNIRGIGSAKCTNILRKSFTASKITDSLSAISLLWLRCRRNNKSLSSSLSLSVAYLIFVIITLAACGGGVGVDGGVDVDVGVDVDGDGLIEIYTADELNLIREDLNGTSLNGTSAGCGGGTDAAGNTITECSGYELMADIDLAAAGYTNWEPLGSSCTGRNSCTNSFDAVFEGNNYTISNITIELSTPTYGIGFFGAISENSELRNVKLDTVTISLSGGGNYTAVGGLVGFARNALIVNSAVVDITIEGTSSVSSIGGLVGYGIDARINSSYAVVDSISGSGDAVGGLVGDGFFARINSSYAVVDGISGNSWIGGLVGYGNDARITSSYVVVNNISGGDYVGGLVGFGGGVIISSSYAVVNSSISGSNAVGGLVGDGQRATITSSYAVVNSSISGSNAVGGLVGYGIDATITSNYAIVASISGAYNVGGLVGFGQNARITSSYALTVSLTATSKVDGLIGDIDFEYSAVTTYFTIVDSSYWLDGVSYAIDGNDATTDRPTFTPAINSGEGKTKEALRSGTDDTGKIYGAVWTNAWCDPATGEFTTDRSSPLATNANLAWDFGSGAEYPALNCLTISLANQRRSSNNVLDGNPPLDGINRNNLND